MSPTTTVTAIGAEDEELSNGSGLMRGELTAISERLKLAKTPREKPVVAGGEIHAARMLARELTARTVGAFVILADEGDGRVENKMAVLEPLQRAQRELDRALLKFAAEVRRLVESPTR